MAANVDLPLVREGESVREAAVRVLHAPAEIAGQASILARALRELGVESHSLAYNPGFPQYQPDEMRDYDARPPLSRYAGYLASLLRHARRYDVYHFHFGRTLIPPHNPDLPLYQALGRKVVFHYHGCDIRDRARMLAHHSHATCTECDPFCNPARQKVVLASAHSSHSYRSGTNLYFTFAARVAERERMPALYEECWRRTMRATLAAGGGIAHHHGIGRVRRAFLGDEIGPVGLDLLRALKHALDPDDLMNPGVLVPAR